ncbi:uncharacterized protein LOC132735167 [Ruditapes philippinarum]|uniref:uncharacterized protein LOC132735167 n=1 Tax=Ruditapes philippinarum TaxID=129788 RepID=UPI00295AA0EE|nr:uncharacterized protein LOC132735167 [Ruditapes philippinarum]
MIAKMEEIRQNIKCKDYIAVLYGFVHTGRKTESYTRERLRLLHQKIYRLLAGLPRCHAKCSSLHKLQFNRWCETCSKWKKELSGVNRSRSVNWEKTESWKWPDSYESIVEVFLPGDWTKSNPIQFSDISTQCHIWLQCREFHLNKTIVKNVRAARNETYHNISFEATDIEKAKAFDALKDLIKDKDIANDINVNEYLSKLDDIYVDDLFYSIDKSVLEEITAVYHENQRSLEHTLSEICDHLESIEVENRYSGTVLDRLSRNFKKKDSKRRKTTPFTTLALTFAFLGCVWYYFVPNHVSLKEYHSQGLDGCVYENYTLPWMQDLPLIEYVRDTNTLVGRHWLFKMLDRKLLQDESSGRGIVSVAEFGYGKSAIVSHLLCARHGEKGRTLREHIAAFHICKYDVSSTQSPERFIRRLVGLFAMRLPEYGNIVSMMSSSSILYDKEKCAKEQDACFDQAFRIPFKNMTSEYSTMIVVIDALDECFHLTKNENFILNLISTRLRYFPKWVKFLITSRDIMQLKEKEVLHNLISKTESEEALDLLLFHHSKVDITDENGVSPAFLAAAKGHLKQLKLLLRKGANCDFAVNPCRKTAERELGKIMKSCNCDASPLDNLIKPLDTWWIVFRETSLHYAIRSGDSHIAEYIAKKTKRLAECVDSYGYTPFLLAIKHGRYQLTNGMKKRANIDICSSSASFLSRQDIAGSGTIIDEKREDICQEGATFAHLIAKYNRVKMIDLFENDVTLKWNIADSSGNKPIHYAASHSSTDFIKFMSLKFGRTAFEEESKNKSTAYHSAAISCSEASLRALTNAFSDNLIDFKDNCNRSACKGP